MGLVGLSITSWYICLFIKFNYLNTKKSKLILLWMKITNQIPNNEVVGLTKRRNDEFWIKENSLFILYLKYIYIPVNSIACLVFNSLYLYIRFEINTFVFYFIQLLHSINLIFYILGKNYICLSLNLKNSFVYLNFLFQ
jgi:hypothetical protein